MSLLAVQTALARLYTDSLFRARFFANPGEGCHGMGLTAMEQRQLAALDRRQVERFARSLQQKRLDLARELLPGTARVMGDRFAEAFFRYCEAQPSALERVEEAKAFAGCLRESVRGHGSDPAPPGYFTDLLTCEQVGLDVLYAPADGWHRSPGVETPVCTYETHVGGSGAFEPGLPARSEGSARSPQNLPGAHPQLTSRAQVAAFQYDMEVLYPKVLSGEGEAAPPDPCFILIGKVRGALRVRLKRINDATARLLMLCDGRRTLAAIVDEVAAGLRLNAADRRAFAAECARFLAPLIEGGLIGPNGVGEGDRCG